MKQLYKEAFSGVVFNPGWNLYVCLVQEQIFLEFTWLNFFFLKILKHLPLLFTMKKNKYINMINCFCLQIHHDKVILLCSNRCFENANFLSEIEFIKLCLRPKVYTLASRECIVEIAEDPKSVCPDEVTESRWRLREGDGSLLDDTNFLVCFALYKKSVASSPISAFFRHSSRTLIRDI